MQTPSVKHWRGLKTLMEELGERLKAPKGKENCDFIASIPMYGKVNSLNASVATGIMIYEAVKQRK